MISSWVCLPVRSLPPPLSHSLFRSCSLLASYSFSLFSTILPLSLLTSLIHFRIPTPSQPPPFPLLSFPFHPTSPLLPPILLRLLPAPFSFYFLSRLSSFSVALHISSPPLLFPLHLFPSLSFSSIVLLSPLLLSLLQLPLSLFLPTLSLRLTPPCVYSIHNPRVEASGSSTSSSRRDPYHSLSCYSCFRV